MGKSFEKKTTKKATKSPSTADLHWAAGFLDGEGSFTQTSEAKLYGDRYCGGKSQRVTCRQLDIEPLEKLLELFGGGLTLVRPKKGKPIWDWHVYGARARGVMQTLFSLLSNRRQIQIRKALFS